MKIKNCRVCGSDFFKEPLLKYENMPCADQYMPDKKTLKKDRGIDLEICQCSGCGLVQISNDSVPYYKEVIRASAVSEEMKNFRLKQFKEFVEKYSLKGKKIIEIGCGKGEYLSIMKQVEADVYGIEQGKESVKECIKDGLNVSRGFVESAEYQIPNRLFNAFFILNFLEHLPNPNSSLKGIYNNLSENAVGIVEVPNFDMMLKKNIFSEFIRDHLFYFNKETLSSTLEKNGFDILDCNEIWHDYIISAIVKKRGKLDLSKFQQHQLKIKNNIRDYLEKFENKKVAIWGAGHQAFTIISLMGLNNKIEYVVDSASFKQGKYTPQSHIPIVSPKELNNNPVEAIIVMAGSYSDEVAGIIRKKYKSRLEDKIKGIDIAILRDFGLEEA